MIDESLSVSELNNFIRDVLSSGFPSSLWVCGEIQGYDRGKDKKHVFFELCEKDQVTREILARAGLVIFANVRLKIDAILKQAENAFTLKDDIEVRFLCKVDFYPAHGQVRLIVESIDPVYTLGKIAQGRQRLIAMLKQNGTLEKNKRLQLPRVPMNIGLVTSYDSAAYHDFIDELKRSNFGFKVMVVNAIMQGKNTESSVIRALKVLSQMPKLEAVVITRGGGSIAELSCFDSQVIAEAIATYRLPVLSGIGHEINTTVTDLAAHTFAKTPTAVAQFLIARAQEFLLYVRQREEDLFGTARERIKNDKKRLKDRGQTFSRVPLAILKDARQTLKRKGEDLKKTIHLRLQNSRAKINSYQKLIEMADPKNTLKRGFTITRADNGKIFRRAKDAAQAGNIITVFADGEVKSTVEKIGKASQP